MTDDNPEHVSKLFEQQNNSITSPKTKSMDWQWKKNDGNRELGRWVARKEQETDAPKGQNAP